MPGGPLTPPKVSQKQPKLLVLIKIISVLIFSTLIFGRFSSYKGIFHTLCGCRGGFRYDLEVAKSLSFDNTRKNLSVHL